MNWRRNNIGLAVFFTGLFGTLVRDTLAQDQSGAPWDSVLYSDHPLVGRIWKSASSAFIDSTALYREIADGRYVLLGEKHDNPDHHRLQKLIVDKLAANKVLSQVAFEMMDSSVQARLEIIQTQGIGSLDELKQYLDWDEEGWDWSFYGPLLFDVLQARIEIDAANISNETMMLVYREPLAGEIAEVLDTTIVDQLNADIDESHCGLLPASQFPAMVRVQQVRDHQMALALTSTTGEGISVLIAGNYHIRQDLGVPNYILALDSAIGRDEIISVALLEVANGEVDPAVYMESISGRGAFDYIWFTPAISDEDYCASLQ
jgi:uncharacterized iron-regulated protein